MSNPLNYLTEEQQNNYYNNRLLALLTDEININPNLSFKDLLIKLDLANRDKETSKQTYSKLTKI
jgi:hypothetical protein